MPLCTFPLPAAGLFNRFGRLRTPQRISPATLLGRMRKSGPSWRVAGLVLAMLPLLAAWQSGSCGVGSREYTGGRAQRRASPSRLQRLALAKDGQAGANEGGARPLIRVVGAVALRDGRVFMAQRPLQKARGGLWEFPGGKVDAGESDREALARELQEELHVRCTVGAFVGTGTDDYVQLHCYLVDMEGEPVLTEHLECRWVPLSDLRDVPVPPADIPVIDAILALEARGWGTSSGAQ